MSVRVGIGAVPWPKESSTFCTGAHWLTLVLFSASFSLFGWLVADGWCWFILREEYCWLVLAGC
jgi:hypothetical protein